MRGRELKRSIELSVLLSMASVGLGCGPGSVGAGNTTSSTSSESTDESSSSEATSGTNSSGDGDGDSEPPPCPPGGCLDAPGDWTDPGGPCAGGDCIPLDVLFVIDGSSSMAEEQLNLAAHYPEMIDSLRTLENFDGDPVPTDAHIMVMPVSAHDALCESEPDFFPPWRPQTSACTERLEDFVLDVDGEQQSFVEACELSCPDPVVPVGSAFIAFDEQGSNVPDDDIAAAFGCLAPQGVGGCEYGAVLETMLQGINPGAEWNTGPDPFLREGAVLVIVIIADEPDCSVRAPDGFEHFFETDTFWPVNPETMTKTESTQATCWNAGVDCGEADPDGVYADCSAVDHGVLFGVDRYIDYMRDELIDGTNKEIVFIGALGVPPVLEHAAEPPYYPIAGGVQDLVYRQWQDGPWPMGDLLPDDPDDAATKQFELGIGPGCTGTDGMGGFVGQGLAPVRVREVCEGLDADDALRCCIESICDPDLSQLFNCINIPWGVGPSPGW